MIKLEKTTITQGFVAAGLMNILGVFIFSRLFTNSVIPANDAMVMSNFGLLMIVVWGFAYISVAKNYVNVFWLIIVFAVEKLIYGCIWIHWLLHNDLFKVYEDDSMAGIFYTIYGFNDWMFCIFFVSVCWNLHQESKH
jgi:hypothetical protein